MTRIVSRWRRWRKRMRERRWAEHRLIATKEDLDRWYGDGD